MSLNDPNLTCLATKGAFAKPWYFRRFLCVRPTQEKFWNAMLLGPFRPRTKAIRFALLQQKQDQTFEAIYDAGIQTIIHDSLVIHRPRHFWWANGIDGVRICVRVKRLQVTLLRLLRSLG